jgi:general nucleoside transport system permease protein
MRWRRLAERAAALSVALAVVTTAFGAALAIVTLSGHPVGATVSAFWQGAFGSPDAIASTLENTIPLTLVALGWIIAFSARRLNIGFEGQLLAGGVIATVVALGVPGLPHAIHLPLAALAGAVGGALWAGLAAALRAFRGVSELLSTFMLNFVAVLLVSYLVRGPLQESSGEFLQSDPIPASAAWPRFGASDLTWDILYVPALVALVMLVLNRTTAGFRLRVLKVNPAAASAAGMRIDRIGTFALVASGAFAGLAGSSLILASRTGAMQDGFSANFWFEGIAAALLARNSPLGCIPAALLFGALRTGSSLVETGVGLSAAVADVCVGLIIVLVAASGLVLMLAERRTSAALVAAGDAAAAR